MTVINANSDKVPRNPRASQGVRRKTPGVQDIIGKTRMTHPFIIPQKDPKHQPSVQEANTEKPRKAKVFFDPGGGQGAGSKFILVPIFYLGTGRGMDTIWTDGLVKISYPKTPRVNPGEKDTTIFFWGGSQRHSKTMSPGTHKNTFSQIITKALKD